jgi:hypothetical protein
MLDIYNGLEFSQRDAPFQKLGLLLSSGKKNETYSVRSVQPSPYHEMIRSGQCTCIETATTEDPSSPLINKYSIFVNS